MPARSTATLSRRSFINLAGKLALWGSGMLSFLGLGRYLSYQPPSNRKLSFSAGPASQFQPGAVVPLPGAKAVIVNNGGSLVALSTICPHLGCEVNWEADQFVCPCHGSRFARDGSVINGPADEALTEVEIDSSDLQNLVLKPPS